jgi:hypothetical protein
MMATRNAYMLAGRLGRRGYDWWWHSLVGINQATGEKQPFFIEYFIINPALGGDVPVLGQLPANQAAGRRPSYGMIKAGTWGKGRAAQIHNFYGIGECRADRRIMDLAIGPNRATETSLQGSVRLTGAEAAAHPEFMSDPGEMSWDLRAEKTIAWSVGYGASAFFRCLDAFRMYWHVPGMKTRYEGTIVWNGQTYRVEPDISAGYQDKNWGRDFTSPWVWLNCNNFRRRSDGRVMDRTSLDVGGGQPVVFGRPLARRLLVAFSHEGRFHEWNFSKFWRGSRQGFECLVGESELQWRIEAWDRQWRIAIDFRCPKDGMILVNYENPRGEKRHTRLWNGGYASGSVSLYRRKGRDWVETAVLDGELGGCEYGEYPG